MATPKGYTDRTQIQDYLLITIDESFWTRVDGWIASMERYIDRETGRNFVADAEASERLFDGDNTDSLIIDDCVDVSEVKIGDNDALTVDDDYVLYPANAPARGVPYTGIKLKGGLFYRGAQNVKVTAKWGFSEAVPDDISFACTVFVAGIITAYGTEFPVTSMTIGRYSVSYDTKGSTDFDESKQTLEHYKKYTT